MHSSTCTRLRSRLLAVGAAFLLSAQAGAQAAPAAQAPADPNLPVRIAEITNTPPANDPAVEIATTGTPGEVAYIAVSPVPGNREKQFFLVIRPTGQGADKGEITSYHLIPPPTEVFYSPVFSPDGSQVLVRQGWPYDFPGYHHLYIINRKTNQIEAGPSDTLTMPIAQWAPNSRYLAYITGNQNDGDEQLMVWDYQTKQSHVVTSGSLSRRFAWTSQNTLLFTSSDVAAAPVARPGAAPPAAPAPKAGAKAGPAPLRSPAVYEVSARGGKPQLVVDGASTPTPSPDGRWVAYFGSERTPEEEATAQAEEQARVARGEWPSVARGPLLCLYDRQAQRRYVIKPDVRGLAPDETQVRWLLDSRKMVVARFTYKKSMDQGKPVFMGQAAISTVDMAQPEQKPVAVVDAQDFEAISWSQTEPQFNAGQLSNGSELPIRAAQYTGISRILTMYVGQSTFRLINLNTGMITNILGVLNTEQRRSNGIDWRQITAGARAELEQKAVATVTAQDFEPVPWSELWPQFVMSQPTNDLKLLVRAKGATGIDRPFYTTQEDFYLIDLRTGAAANALRLLDITGYDSEGADWRENVWAG